MKNIVRAYVDAGFNVCNPIQAVCTLNYNGGGYTCIAGVIKHDLIHPNAFISNHDVDINLLKNISGNTNEFEFSSDKKSINSWSYSRPYVPGVFTYDENCAAEEHGESDIASDAEVLEEEIVWEDDSCEDDYIMDKDLDIDKSALTDALDLQLSTG